MIDDKDIEKLIGAFGEVFPTKTDLLNFQDHILKDFDELKTSIDSYAGKADKYFQEMLMLAHKVDRLERWIKQIADKIGMKLEQE